MGNVGRQIARPFEYAARTGSSETHETGRYNTGGYVLGSHVTNKIHAVDLVSSADFENHLRNKGLPADAINYFSVLKYVQNGAREHKEFELRRDSAHLEKIGVAVNKINPNQVNIAVIWDQFMVKYAPPQTVINFVERNYGLGYRTSKDFSRTVDRGLTGPELNNIQTILNNFANTHNTVGRAQESLS